MSGPGVTHSGSGWRGACAVAQPLVRAGGAAAVVVFSFPNAFCSLHVPPCALDTLLFHIANELLIHGNGRRVGTVPALGTGFQKQRREHGSAAVRGSRLRTRLSERR